MGTTLPVRLITKRKDITSTEKVEEQTSHRYTGHWDLCWEDKSS